MKAITTIPGTAGSAQLDDLEAPTAGPGEMLVQGISMGVCGTDHEILDGRYGWLPPGKERLVLGHESLGRVIEAPTESGFSPGDLVVGYVRRPDPVPCIACAVGQWDMCRNGLYVEHGIKALDGFGAQRYVVSADAAIRVPDQLGHLGVLVEPASILAKAWDHIERIGGRAAWAPHRVLVTGAGPVGLLAALFAHQRGHEVHVLDHVTDGPKPGLVADLGATYHSGAAADACPGADVVIECTGVGQLVFDVLTVTAAAGIVCLTGVSSGGRTLSLDAGAINREIVLENDVVFGSVNANATHYRAAVETLARADPAWLGRVITRTVPLADWTSAFERRDDDVKVVIDLESDT